MMWETLLQIARQMAAAPPAMTALADSTQPNQSASMTPQTATEPACPNPGQSHSAWTLDSEDRWFDGPWVMHTRHYSRTVTDNCDGTETTETKTEGPVQLWQAVPGRRVANVNRPAGTDDTVTGAPLHTSDIPAGQQAAPVGPQYHPATNTPGLPTPTGKGSTGAAPLLPGALLLVGLLVAAWRQKLGGGGPDLDGQLLELKIRQYQSLARRGQWSARKPQFSADPDFAGYAELWHKVKPETQATIDGWENEWDAVSAYWEKFFAGTDRTGAPPPDKWGIGDIAKAHAAELLQGQLARFRAILHQLAEDPGRFDALSPELQDLARSIEHLGSVFPSEEVKKMVGEAFAGDEAMLGQLVVDLKKQQYRELARAGRFDRDNPMFSEDERYKAFTIITPLLDTELNKEIDRNQAAWKQAATYWRGRVSGDSAGPAPDDVLGISAAAVAALADLKRRERLARTEQADSAQSQNQGTSDGAVLASAVDVKRRQRWEKREEEDMNRQNAGGALGTSTRSHGVDDPLSDADWQYLASLLAGTGYSLDDLGSRDSWETGVAGEMNYDGALIEGGINYSQLITDDAFTDSQSMSESEIREFLNKYPNNVIKNPSMPVFEYAEDNKTKRDSGRTVDVAHLIYLCSRAFGINPKVLLTKLDKEESLVGGKWQGERIEPNWKMMILGCGFGVSDGKQQTSDYHWTGIDRQIVLAALLSRYYFNDGSRRYPTPAKYPATFPTGEGPVPVFNRATWVLYRYTPHTVTEDGQGNIAFAQIWDAFFGKRTRGAH